MASSPTSRQWPRRPVLAESGLFVLVFAHVWDNPEATTLEHIRTELRQLGASLLVVDRESLFYFRPMLDAHSNASPPELSPETLAELAQSYGVSQLSAPGAQATLSVLDDGDLRLHVTRYLDADLAEALLEALRLANQRLQRPDSRALPHRELAVYSLVGALTRVLSECSTRQEPEDKRAPSYLSNIRPIRRTRRRVSA